MYIFCIYFENSIIIKKILKYLCHRCQMLKKVHNWQFCSHLIDSPTFIIYVIPMLNIFNDSSYMSWHLYGTFLLYMICIHVTSVWCMAGEWSKRSDDFFNEIASLMCSELIIIVFLEVADPFLPFIHAINVSLLFWNKKFCSAYE